MFRVAAYLSDNVGTYDEFKTFSIKPAEILWKACKLPKQKSVTWMFSIKYIYLLMRECTLKMRSKKGKEKKKRFVFSSVK